MRIVKLHVFLLKYENQKNIIPIQFQQHSPTFHKIIIHNLKQNSYLFHNKLAVYRWGQVPQSANLGPYTALILWGDTVNRLRTPPKADNFYLQTLHRAKKSYAEPSWEQNIPLVLVIWKGM